MNSIDKQFTEGEFTWFGLDFLSKYGDHDKCNYVLGSCEVVDTSIHSLKKLLQMVYETY